ncbi:MAG: heme synthase [Polaromonas sp.]|nr:heme synthase [Polaromonas sp.]
MPIDVNPQDLYNLSPALQLMLTGLTVALGPLIWVWLRSRGTTPGHRLRVLTLVTLFLTFDLVLFGAFTRLTDSGLGCPDWPGCYGHASPVGAQVHIEAAQAALPSGPVTRSKAWIEMVHRYLATGVGVLILTLAVGSWLESRRSRATAGPAGRDATRASVWWACITLAWVCLQGAFGALTVTMKLFPAIVTLHLLGGLVLLALLKVQAVRHGQVDGGSAPVTLTRRTRACLWLAFALLWVQIALGGWVSTNYAVLACTGFPACQGSLWPAMDLSQGFTLWRALGAAGDGGNITFQALTAIHYVHRLVAYAVFAALLALAFSLHRVPVLRSQARWLAGLLLLQVATGLGNVVLGWPLLAAVSHTGGAAALVMVMTGLVLSSRGAPASRATASAPKLAASRVSA